MNEDLQRLVDIEEIKKLKARYFRLLDTKAWDAWESVFAENLEFVFAERDLTLDRSSPPSEGTAEGPVISGRAHFIAWTKTTSGKIFTAHHGHTPEITVTGPNTATGIWAMADYLQWPGKGEPVGLRGYGHYHEEYVRTSEGWRVKRVTLKRLRIDPLAGGLPAVHRPATPTGPPD